MAEYLEITEYGWACAWVEGFSRPLILLQTVSETREEAMQAMADPHRRDGDDWRRAWKRIYRKGARCIRVSVSPALGYGGPSDA